MDEKTNCEKCQASLNGEPYVFSCSYDCTFCRKATLRGVCPNCSGELVRKSRPSSED